jgi:hypothetical protein
MSITIRGDFDGGNPQQRDRIIRLSEKEFIVYPFSEDEDPNYKFRMDLKIQNSAQSARTVSLTVDWQTEKYMEYRDYIYVNRFGGEDWHFHPAKIQKTKSIHDLPVGPGESYLCLHPRYNYEDYLNFVGSIPESGFVEKDLLGLSQEGREIWCFKISDSHDKRKSNILGVARIHPYETSGSYCAEGIIGAYADPTEKMKRVLEKYNIYIVPMISPDGVYHGFGKLTSWAGVDLSKQVEEKDASSVLLKSLIDTIKPSVYMEFHNWMFKDSDGIFYLNAINSYRFIVRMPSQTRYGKNWKPMLRRKIFSFFPTGFKKYCKEKYRSICVCFEYPWFNRDIPAMRKLGASTLSAISRL